MRKIKYKIDELGCCGTIFFILGFLLTYFAIICLEGWILMWLWNWLLVSLFGISTIGFWQSVGFMLLLNLIRGFFKIRVNKD